MHHYKSTKKSIIVKAPNKTNVNHRFPPNANVNSGRVNGLNYMGQPRSPLVASRTFTGRSINQGRDAAKAKVKTFTTVDFIGPVKPSFIFVNYPGLLTKEEEKEIMQYREIYYIRQAKPPVKQINSYQNGSFFKFVKDDHIAYRYQQEHIVGKGSFGSVLQCFDHKTKRRVAIKLLSHKPKLHSQIMFELELLKLLQTDEKNNNNDLESSDSMISDNKIIKFIDAFDFRSFFCIVMELASYDLYTFLQRQNFHGLSLKLIQIIARDTATGLSFMHQKGIIHCDIKPENILFESISFDGIKIIDFGCSCYVGKILYSYIQSRYYRAPEVILGREYGTEIDMWSLGCVICELFTGTPLFPARDEVELMAMLINVIGMPPKSLIEKSPRAQHYFSTDPKTGVLISKQSPLNQKDSQNNNENDKNYSYKHAFSEIHKQTKIRDKELLDLIVRCLRWDPKERITAVDFLQHKWIKRPIKECI